MLKPGYKTTEALVIVVAAFASWLSHWLSTLSTHAAARNTTLVAIAYAVSRGLAKLGPYLAAFVASQQQPVPPPVTPPQ